MNLLLLVLALNIFEISGGDEKETHERAASLVVLPPLVLGYEELYVNNDDNQPAKKDMDYPNEDGWKKGTQVAILTDERQQSGKIDQKIATTQTKKAKTQTTMKIKKLNRKVKEKKDQKKADKVKLTVKKDKQKDFKKDKKVTKKDDKKVTKKNTKKKNTNRSAKHNKKNKQKGKGKKKGKRKGKVQSSQSSSESNSESTNENTNESQSQSELSNDYDTSEINNLLEILNNRPSVYGLERIYPTLPTRPGRMPTRIYDNFNQDLRLSNHGFTRNKGMIIKNRITKQTPLSNDKTNVMGLNLKQTTSSLNKLISLLSRRMSKSSDLIGDKKTKLRSGDDKKGVITLKGQGEIGDGKEVLEFTGNFRVPKKVLDCPCFKEILQKEKPSFKDEDEKKK